MTTGTSGSRAIGISAAVTAFSGSGGTGGTMSGGGWAASTGTTCSVGWFIAISKPLGGGTSSVGGTALASQTSSRQRRAVQSGGNRQRHRHPVHFVAVAASASSETFENPALFTAPSRSMICAYWIVRSPRT